MSQNDELLGTLRAGIEAVRGGDRRAGRRLLETVVRADPQNEVAWLWLASCMTTIADRRACLQRVLQINPDNERAREALKKLGGTVPEAMERPTPPAQARTGGFDLLNVLLVVIGAVAVFAVLLLISQFDRLFGGPAPTPTIPAAMIRGTNTPVPPSPTPRTPIPFTGQSGAPTLPPTFTPTATAPPTATPTPTATPLPLELFELLVVRQDEDADYPDLYRLKGDGSSEARIGSDFRDVAYDLAGRRIAFVRDVFYDAAEENGDGGPRLPEIFIAEMNSLSRPRQLTDMRTTFVGSPVWSPDGEELLFVSDRGGSEDLWLISASGGEPRNLTASEFIDRDPAWRPLLGSREIVFASDMNSVGSTELYRMILPEPGETPVYTRLTTANNSSYAPAWSFDGRQITFVSDRSGGDADIYVMNADGSGQTLVTIDDGGAEDRHPSFTPDGRYIVFSSNREDDRFQIYLAAPDGSLLTRLTRHDSDDLSAHYRPEVLLRLQEEIGP